MFESINQNLQKVFARFQRGGKLTDGNIQDGLREIRQALLDADVHFKVAKDLIDEVTNRAVGEKVIESVTPAQQIVKIFHDVLTAAMASDKPLVIGQHGPTVIMLAGLQGSGKTTTAGKLANLLKKRGRQPLLVAADLQRPAAVDQLKVLGQQLGIPVLAKTGVTPPELCAEAIPYARSNGHDVVILDTAGRLHVDEPLMEEVAAVKARAKPHHVFFVCDAMTGQDAVNSARAFHERLALDGVILTKLDGDTRGGAAISIRHVTGAPVRFVGLGEKLDQLEEFHADRMASRVLGMGDVVSLVERAQSVVDEKQAEEAVTKLLTDEFTFEDFLFQLRSMKKLGPLKDVLAMLPGGLGAQLQNAPIDEKQLDRVEAVICSMTREERLRPDVLDVARRRRVARGSGNSLDQVNAVVKQFAGMRQMMKQLKSQSGLMGKMAARFMPGMSGAKQHKAQVIEEMRKKGDLLRAKRKLERDRKKQNRRRR